MAVYTLGLSGDARVAVEWSNSGMSILLAWFLNHAWSIQQINEYH